MARLRIGIVGCGAIGSSLAKTIHQDLAKLALVVSLYDIDIRKSKRLSISVSRTGRLAVKTLAQLISKSDLVIEAASSKSSCEIAQNVLASKCDIMVMSVGGIVKRFIELSDLAGRNNASIYIPSGAICGIDGLKAARLGKIKKVTLKTTKNPVSFKNVEYIKKRGIKLNSIKEDTLLFSGTAKDAIKYFPQNINVAAILSIAGIGHIKTRVEIVASPKARRNIHEIRIISQAGDIYTRTENILHPKNPKTSYLAFLSAVATLKEILEPVKIGT